MRNTTEPSFIKVTFLLVSLDGISIDDELWAINSFQYFALQSKWGEREKKKKKSWSTFSSNADTFYEPDSWLSNEGKGKEKRGKGDVIDRWESKEKVKGHELFIAMNIYGLIRFSNFFFHFSMKT